VAVAGWQWACWKEEMEAVRMILDRVWRWRYWLCCGGLKMGKRLLEILETSSRIYLVMEYVRAGWLWGVAVAGWYRWKEEMEAVRMVLDRVWQWQYWLRYGVLKMWHFFLIFFVVVVAVWY
jgi:hypothetical protein